MAPHLGALRDLPEREPNGLIVRRHRPNTNLNTNLACPRRVIGAWH